MNTEPVAWIINGRLSDEFYTTSELDKIIPLYTYPAKTLNKEEILKLAEEFDIWLGDDDIEFIQFVLRKAQENV